MLDFIIVSLPRSGSTWLSNYLTTDHSICHHDPLYQAHYTDWDIHYRARAGKIIGVCCTGVWRWPEWLNNQSRKVIIIDRALRDIERSMRSAGLRRLPCNAEEKLKAVNGLRIDFSRLFVPATLKRITDYLSIQYDEERALSLVAQNIQPQRDKIKRDPRVEKKLINQLIEDGEVR